jgi:tetratricopeptide (TPR) repeat protein
MNLFSNNLANAIWAVGLLGLAGWLFVRSIKSMTAPGWLVAKVILTLATLYFEFTVAKPAFARGGGEAITGLMLTLVLAIVINILWRNAIVDFITNPLTSLFTGGNEPPVKQPYYSVATAKRKRGQYEEAIAEVRKQLEIFPNNFEGVLLLAGIQAENLSDLPAAENTLNHFCDQTGVPLKQVANALTQLADWHIRVADKESARAEFQKIIDRFPDTEPALRAELRIAHLAETEKMILAQHDRRNITIPVGVQNIGLLDSTAFLKPQAIDPARLATARVAHLESHPHDTEAREQLAMIYANDFKRLDLAMMEMAQLINEPTHKPKQVARWLHLAADFQLKLGADVATVQATLENILERFPNLPVAEVAQRRLARLNSEFRGRQEATVVKLGVYEQNIGLKYGAPQRP